MSGSCVRALTMLSALIRTIMLRLISSRCVLQACLPGHYVLM